MHLTKANLQKCTILFSIILLSACGGVTTKPSSKEPSAPTSQSSDTSTAKPGAGGYYLDDGPGEGAPADIDSIPNAQITNEPPLERSKDVYKRQVLRLNRAFTAAIRWVNLARIL